MLGDLVVASLGVQVAAHSAGVAPRLSENENVSGHGVGQAALMGPRELLSRPRSVERTDPRQRLDTYLKPL